MPSEFSPAARSREHPCPDVVAKLPDGAEDPTRWLDRDLSGYRVGQVPGDRDTGMGVENWLEARIDGIDRLAVANGWLAVEQALERTPDDGRELVVSMIRQRIRELAREGDRWERLDRDAARARKQETVGATEDRDAEWYRELAAQSGPGAVGSTARETFGSPAEQLAQAHEADEADDGGETDGSPLAEELDGLEGQLDPGVATDGGDER